MKTSDFNYKLDERLIAQESVEPRDRSRLMVVDRKNKRVEHKVFTDIVDYFKKGDVLVWNNSKVFKARLFGKLHSGTGRNLLLHEEDAEIFLVRPMENEGVWKALARPSAFVHPGMQIQFGEDFYCTVIFKDQHGKLLVEFPYSDDDVRKKANKYGQIPIPPYIKDEPEQFESYQTVYAKEEGSVAAPTAGFHFTSRIIEQLREKGVEFAEVTLHVGLGTFLPVKTDDVSEHEMHGEWVELKEEDANKINVAKAEGRRIVAVGTTSVRTLEGVVQFGALRNKDIRNKQFPISNFQFLHPYKGDIDLFILPGFEFQIVDVMITNFHLPKSTLLMLVSAFAGDRKWMLSCYDQAVKEQYRFFSFGDAMILL